MKLIDYTENASPNHQLDILEYLLDSCNDLSFELVEQEGFRTTALEVVLRAGNEIKGKALMEFGDSELQRDRLIDFVQRRAKITDYPYLIDEPVKSYMRGWGTSEATNGDLDKALNALKWAVQLKYWSPILKAVLDDPQQPTPTRKWALLAALAAEPAAGADTLVQRFDDFAFDYDNFVKMVVVANPPKEAIAKIRDRANKKGGHDLFATSLTALFGSTDEVVALLSSVIASDRATASNFLPLRNDLAQIAAAMEAKPLVFERSLRKPFFDNLIATSKQIDEWIAAIPEWSLDWRVSMAGPTYGALSGIQLKYIAAIVARKQRGIERPYNEAILGFSSWR